MRIITFSLNIGGKVAFFRVLASSGRRGGFIATRYSRNRISRRILSGRNMTLYADSLNNRPKFTLEGHIGTMIYRADGVDGPQEMERN